MEDSNPEGLTEPPPIATSVAKDRKAGWWAWPLIVLSVIYIVYQTENPPPEPELEGSAELTGDDDLFASPAGDLAILQLQGKIVVGTSLANPMQAQVSVKQLEGAVNSDTSAFAVAILHRFVNLNEKGMTNAEAILDRRRKSAGANPKYLEKAWQVLSAGVSEEERDELIGHLGWFGSILPEDADGTVPNRVKIQSEGLFAVGLTSIGMIGGFFAGLIGLTLLIVALVKRNEGKFTTRFRAMQRPARVFLEAFALYLAIMALADLLGIYLETNGPEIDDVFQPADLLYFLPQVLFVGAFVVGLFWPCLRGNNRKEIFQLLGLHRGSGIGREILAGLVGYIAMIPVAAVGMIVMIILMFAVGIDITGTANTEPVAVDSVDSSESVEIAEPVPTAPTHPAAEWVATGGWKMKLFIFVLAAIIAPLFEEIMFRGALFRAFRSGWGFILSALVGGFIFAIIHPQGWIAAPALTAMGVGFAMIREWRDSLIAPMVAHAVNNGLIVGALILVM